MKSNDYLPGNVHIDEVKNVNEWAKSINRPVYSLRRYIKKAFGCTPKEYIQEKKIRRVIILLRRYKQYSLWRIARKAGFKDGKAITNFLRYHTEKNPSDFK